MIRATRGRSMDGWMDGSMHGCRDAWMRGCMEMHALTKEMTTTRKVQPRKRQNQHFVVVNSGGLEGQNGFSRFRGCTFHVEGAIW